MQYSYALIDEIQQRQLAFTHGLHEAGLSRRDTLEQAFKFTLLLFEAEEEKRLRAGEHISPARKAQLMEEAQKLLSKMYTETWE
jgi:hypothetical protein